MEVWLLEAAWDEYSFEQILLHVPNSGIWIVDNGISKEYLVISDWTDNFWAELGKKDNLTYIGDL